MDPTSMAQQLGGLWPEIFLALGAGACLITGLWNSAAVRRSTFYVAVAAVLLAAGAACVVHNAEGAGQLWYAKLAILSVGLLLLGVVRTVPATSPGEHAIDTGEEAYDAANTYTGEFFAFFLASLTGALLCAGARDLVWLFLALELTSLPTYVLVATARNRIEAQEAGVKYFFLGAMAAAIFLYGFTLIYGATGFTDFHSIHATILAAGDISPMLLAGLILSVLGIAFKIAAFPMHFYAADVYQGANVGVSAFLAFVPKTAGFLAIIAILSLIDFNLPAPLAMTLWIMAAVTMTAGNVLGLLQNNVKRLLAYSSVAHSGYMLVGLLGGLSGVEGHAIGNGVGAVLFYLVAYGLANLAAFGVVGCLQAQGEEAQTIDDLSGLSKRHPALAAILLVAALSLIGLPPTIGFIGKIYLFGSALSEGYVWLVVIGVINSAIAAVYYLKLAAACYLGEQAEGVQVSASWSRVGAAGVAAVLAVLLGIVGSPLVGAARHAAEPGEVIQAAQPDAPQPQARIEQPGDRS